MSRLTVFGCFFLATALVGCSSKDGQARTLTNRLTSDGWVRAEPNWICDDKGCSQASEHRLSTKERDALTFYLELAPDGSARRAYPSKPEWEGWDDGTTKTRCQSGSWSLDGDAITLHFAATKDDPAIDERRTPSYFLDFVRMTREGGSALDYEDWHDSLYDGYKATLDAWCPRP